MSIQQNLLGARMHPPRGSIYVPSDKKQDIVSFDLSSLPPTCIVLLIAEREEERRGGNK
jgi:hypothetical protein